jgi:hypothetical protein
MARQPFFFGNLGSTSPVLGHLEDKPKYPLSHMRRPVHRIAGILFSGSEGGKVADGISYRRPRKPSTRTYLRASRISMGRLGKKGQSHVFSDSDNDQPAPVLGYAVVRRIDLPFMDAIA